MPALSPTMTEGSIVNWLVKEGDKVSTGDILCEVQTDKAVVGLETDEEGTLAKIIVNSGSDNIQIGDLIALLANDDEDWTEVANSFKPQEKNIEPVSEAKPKVEIVSSANHVSSSTEISKLHLIGPAAKNLIEKHKIDVNSVKGSGPFNNILKNDILQYLNTSPTKLSSPSISNLSTAPYIDIPLSNMRKTIANRLTKSKTTIPHGYVTKQISTQEITRLRKLFKANNISLSVNDLIIKACALALRLVPEINMQVINSENAKRMENVDISIAVATPDGLITPIIFNSDKKTARDISKNMHELAQKARDKKLQPQEFMGGGFSISNLGMFGITEFTAIINPPQTAILACGSSIPSLKYCHKQKRMISDGSMKITLSIDSRFIDEVTAGRFLSHVSNFLSDSIISLFLDDKECLKLIRES